MPAAIAAQNRRCSSRPATTGRPGENNSARPDRSERRLCFLIATPPFKVLRRPFEASQYTALAFSGRCREAGIRPSMGSVGDAYDNAMCESFFATLECELLARRRFGSQAEARMTVFSYIEGWYNPARRHSGIGYLSPNAYETTMANQIATT
jgi:putative transposase